MTTTSNPADFAAVQLPATTQHRAAAQNFRRLFDLETYGRTTEDVALGDEG